MKRRAAAALLALAVGFAGAVHALSEWRLGRRFDAPLPALDVSGDAAQRARGEQLVRRLARCTSCHGHDLGGKLLADDFWLGRLQGPNLTPGRGGIAERSDAELAAAIRWGVAPDGRSLAMMPTESLRRLPDADLAAIVAYLRALPPIDRQPPPTRVGPLTRVVVAFGLAPGFLAAEVASPDAPREPPPGPGDSEYGAWLVGLTGCTICHHSDLRGGRHPLALPDEPTPPDLRPGGALAGWSEGDFRRALREGVTPDGRVLDARYMPWPELAQLGDAELEAIWAHLRALPD